MTFRLNSAPLPSGSGVQTSVITALMLPRVAFE